MTRETPTVVERRGGSAVSEQLPARFEYVREIARGGMGRVLEVFDRELGRTVALKLSLSLDEATRRRFAREVAITARLEHPSIVPVYDGGRSPTGEPYYVMRRVGGAPLDERVRAAAGLDQRLQLVPHLLQMADAVAHAHQRGIVHRDLKPSNVLLGELGETIVIDWGLAKLLAEADAEVPPRAPVAGQTVAGTVIGTPGFMAPEQAAGSPVDVRCDVYALGATLYFALAARLPVSGSETEMLGRTLTGEVPPLATVCPGVPAELVAITEKAMAVEPGDRYLDAGGFAEELRRFLEGRLVSAHHYTTRERIARWVRRRRALVVTAATSLVVLVAIATLALGRVLEARTRAERALERERERSDELVVSRARAYVPSDPTRAAAMLAELRPASPQWAKQRGLIAEIVGAGAAWGYPGHGVPASLAPAADGAILTSGGGVVRLISLADHRVTTLVDDGGTLTRGLWAGERVAIFGRTSTAPILLVDPASSHREELVWPEPPVTITAAPGLVAFVDRLHRPVAVELRADGKAAPAVIAAGTVDDLIASPSGKRLLALTHDATRVFERQDAGWTVIATLPLSLVRPAFGGDGRIAIVDARGVVELDAATGRELRRCLTPSAAVLVYAGDELFVKLVRDGGTLEIARCLTSGELLTYRSLAPMIGRSLAGSRGAAAVLLTPRTIEVGLGGWSRTIASPLETSEIAFAPGGRWLIASAPSQILAWDLERLRPAELAAAGVQVVDFLSPTALLAVHPDPESSARVIQRIDLTPTGFAAAAVTWLATVSPTAEIRSEEGIVKAIDRILERRQMIVPASGDANDPTSTDRDGAVVIGTVDGVVRRAGVEMGRLPGPVDAIAARGPWLAAAGGGQLWRRGPDGVARIAFAPTGALRITDEGVVVIAAGRDLYVWTRFVPPVRVGQTTSEVVDLHVAPGGAVALALADGTLARFDPRDGRLLVLATTVGHLDQSGTAFAANGTLAAVPTTGGLIAIDLGEGTTWTVVPEVDLDAYAVAPDGASVVIAVDDKLLRFRTDRPALAPATLRALTNAHLEPTGDALTWSGTP